MDMLFSLVMWVYLIESPFCLSRTHFNLCLFSPKTHFWSTMFTCLVYFTYDMIFGQIISEPDAFEQYHIWRQSRIHTAHTFAYIKKLTLRKTNFNVERPKDKNHISPCLVREKFSQKVLQYPSHRILRYVHGALNVDENKN